MVSRRLKQRLMLVLILIGSSSLCRAQELKLVKDLDEHSFVVERNGKRFKAVDDALLNEQAKAFDKLTAERDAARNDGAEADKQIATLRDENKKLTEKVSFTEQQRDLAKNDLQDTRVFVAQQKQLLDQETQLRKDTAQFVPHSSGNGFAGKLLDFFDKPAVQGLFKIGFPLLQTGRSFMTRCGP
jgi:chromosome segregation ATPase